MSSGPYYDKAVAAYDYELEQQREAEQHRLDALAHQVLNRLTDIFGTVPAADVLFDGPRVRLAGIDTFHFLMSDGQLCMASDEAPLASPFVIWFLEDIGEILRRAEK